MFKGAFIGIDRYASPAIKWLACARRDAVALHALFSDTLGDGGTLLTDEEATRANIEKVFAELAQCSEDDVVVVAFSGHGTETHELVTYDADRSNLPGTCIPLDTLTEWFSRIPAKNVICILDCCFSGGMGAKALRVDALPRDLPSADALLKQLSGEGRLILTASLATERAWENQRLGHGFLTFHLLAALQGAEEVVESGKLAAYRLFEYVTRRVMGDAANIGHEQHPTLRGTLNGDITWPIFRPGTRYQAAFPERGRAPVTEDLQSLGAYGFPPELLAAWSRTIPTLNALQRDAVNEFQLFEHGHLTVSAPTSSGKTMVGELAAIRGALDRGRALFLFPLKAIVNDKFRQFNQTYGDFGIRTIRATGETTSDEILPLMRGQYDVCLMTYEKCAAMLLGNPHLLDQVSTIVIDEVQMIADPSRGVNLEFLLTLLRLRRRQGAEPQLIALSAVIGDTNGLERWLGARLLKRTARPVPLDEGILRFDGGFRYIASETGQEQVVAHMIQPQYRKGSSQDLVIPLVRKLVQEGKSIIVFRETKGLARGCAKYLAESLGLPPAREALDALPTGDLSLSSGELRQALAGGVGFHIADLDPDERQVIEEQFRQRPSTLKVLAATTTLAMGVNTPAEAVVIAGLEHPGKQPYTIAEYKNIAGRAGRLGFAERGSSYLIALSANDERYYWTRYVKGTSENLTSHFLGNDTDPRSLILRVLVTAEQAGEGMSPGDIIGFLEESFGVFLRKQQTPNWTWDRRVLDHALDELRRHSLVELDAKGVYRLTPIGRLAGVAGVEVESLIRVIAALSGTDPAAITDPSLIAATQLTTELDQVLFPINRKSTQKEPQTWFSELQQQGVLRTVMAGLSRSVREEHQPALRAKKAVACLLWISGRPMSEIEEIMTQFGGKFDGAAGPMRAVKARTCDILPIVAQVAELLHPGLSLGDRTQRLIVRLELGLPAAAIDLALHAADRLSRGDYLRLTKAGLAGFEALEAAGDAAILSCIDKQQGKLAVIRNAVVKNKAAGGRPAYPVPILGTYEA